MVYCAGKLTFIPSAIRCRMMNGKKRSLDHCTKKHILLWNPLLQLKLFCKNLDHCQCFSSCRTGVNGDLRGYIDSGNDDGSFHLDAQDGSLRVARKLDFETK